MAKALQLPSIGLPAELVGLEVPPILLLLTLYSLTDSR